MTFIKLTEANGKILIINIARIEHICLGARGSDTFIKMLPNVQSTVDDKKVKENYFFVKETLEDIWVMLNPPTMNGKAS